MLALLHRFSRQNAYGMPTLVARRAALINASQLQISVAAAQAVRPGWKQSSPAVPCSQKRRTTISSTFCIPFFVGISFFLVMMSPACKTSSGKVLADIRFHFSIGLALCTFVI